MVYNRFAAVDENELFPLSVREALAASPELRSLIIPMTQVQRNNLTGTDLWDGRVVANTTTDRLNRYDAGSDSWKVVLETADLSALTSADTALDARLDTAETDINNAESAIAALDVRLDAQEAYINARVRSTSAGVQDNGFGRKYLDTGFGGWRANPPVFMFAKLISGTYENDGIHMTGYASSSIVYIDRTGGLSNGDPILVTVID